MIETNSLRWDTFRCRAGLLRAVQLCPQSPLSGERSIFVVAGPEPLSDADKLDFSRLRYGLATLPAEAPAEQTQLTLDRGYRARRLQIVNPPGEALPAPNLQLLLAGGFVAEPFAAFSDEPIALQDLTLVGPLELSALEKTLRLSFTAGEGRVPSWLLRQPLRVGVMRHSQHPSTPSWDSPLPSSTSLLLRTGCGAASTSWKRRQPTSSPLSKAV